ncbi:MAG: S16 family serine protease [Gammaproteobacteria bacterium]
MAKDHKPLLRPARPLRASVPRTDRIALERIHYRSRLEALVIPNPVRERIQELLQRLALMPDGSPEHAASCRYLDVITSLPWGRCSEDRIELDRVRAVLDRNHEGLDDVKARIVEFLALSVFKGRIAGPALLLVGPPGVGKTTLAKAIAEALGCAFHRLNIAGLRGEEPLKGKWGTAPGRFVQALSRVGFADPVLLLRDVDSLGGSAELSSALLEVLDSEQNSCFWDHYLDLPFDLSQVLFLCTASQTDTIPTALLDRMQVIRLAGYTTDEKIAIARKHAWPRLCASAGVRQHRVQISKAGLRKVVEGYAREPGMRTFEQQLSRILRKAAVRLLQNEAQPIRIGIAHIETYLGAPLYRYEPPIASTGSAIGLAVTAKGGTILFIEAAKVYANRGFKLTGMLGNVMKESAEIAYSYVAANLERFKANPAFFDESFVHLHMPEGATPKDGPSAGITIATALLSLARNQSIPRSLAMTGELTLSGKVLAVGGIRDKVTAAKRVKVMEIILPEYNRRDFSELPDHVRKGLTVHFVRNFPEVVRIVFSESGQST